MFHVLAGMCVLAGCDFLSSIPGIGVKRAYSLVSKYRNLGHVSLLSLQCLTFYMSTIRTIFLPFIKVHHSWEHMLVIFIVCLYNILISDLCKVGLIVLMFLQCSLACFVHIEACLTWQCFVNVSWNLSANIQLSF